MVVPAMSSCWCQLILEVKFAPLMARSMMHSSCLALLSCCLFSHPSLHHGLPLSKRQTNGFVRCFELHLQKWCETTVLPIDIQIVLYQGMAVLLDAFIKVCPIRIEMPKPVIDNPLIATAIMVH
jgi:hypothetical protein